MLLAPSSGYHGFVLAGGKFTTLDIPAAVDTLPMASNARGVIVGQYTDDPVPFTGSSRGRKGLRLSAAPGTNAVKRRAEVRSRTP